MTSRFSRYSSDEKTPVRRRWSTRVAATILCCLAVFAGNSKSLRGQFDDSVDVRTVRGLSERRLYELARSHAESSLKTAGNDLEKARLAAALIDVLTREALTSAGELRQSSWDRATRRALELEQELSGKPGGLLVSVQTPLIDLARLEQIVREIEIGQAGDEERVAARDLSVRIQRDIDSVKARLLEALNQTTGSRRDGDLDAAALRGLRYNLEYQGARALILGGELYGKEDQTSRIDVMAQAESRLLECAQSIGPGQPLWWSIQADRLRAARVAGNRRLFANVVSSLPSGIPDQYSRNRLNTELILDRVETGDYKEALALAGEEITATTSPDLDVSRLRLFIAISQSSAADSKTWQQKALDLTARIEASHGPWWGRRASLLVVGIAGSSGGSGNLDLLVRVASEAQQKRSWPEAIAALDAAVVQAEADNNQELAASLAFRAAAIEQEQEKHGEAAKRFEAISIKYPEWPRASSAHLMACWNLARIVSTDAESAESYQRALEHHIQTWPMTSGADQARIWLSAMFQARQQWKESLVLLANVSRSGSTYPEALERILQLIPFYLSSQGNRNGNDDELLNQLARTLETSLRKAEEVPAITADVPSPRFAELATLAALRWVYGVDGALDTGDELVAQLTDPAHAPLSDRARALLVIRSAWNGVDAAANIGKLQEIRLDVASQEMLRTGLAGDYSASPPPGTCHETLLAAANLLATQIDAAGKRTRYLWDQSRVKALIAVDHSDGLEKVRSIAGQYPSDMAMQLALGRYWHPLAMRDSAQIAGALGHWRKLASGIRPNSPEWFEAKLCVARLLAASGKTADARRMLEYMQAVPPGWKNSSLAAEFDQLLSSLPASDEIPK
jgi:tetratricopeptide (TPR) repeat protein